MLLGSFTKLQIDDFAMVFIAVSLQEFFHDRFFPSSTTSPTSPVLLVTIPSLTYLTQQRIFVIRCEADQKFPNIRLHLQVS